MEFYKDLLEVENSKFRVFGGIVFLVLAIIMIAVTIYEKEPFGALDWMYILLFAINGIINIIEGLGKPVASLLGKSFILINREKIAIKTGVFKEGTTVYWNHIKSINYKTNQFVIISQNSPTLALPITNLEYSTVMEMKAIVREIAARNGIENNL